MVRLVIGADVPPQPSFFVDDAPRFAPVGAAPGAALVTQQQGDRYAVLDGAEVILRCTAHVSPWLLDVEIAADATVYGFGAATGAPTRDGARFRLMTRDTIFFGIQGACYTAFPIFWVRTARETRAFLVVTTYPLDVEVTPGHVRLRGACDTEGTPVDVIALRGSPREILSDLGALVGRTFLPPAWALGFHQSRWSYKTQEVVLDVARRFRKEELPADVVHLDIHYMDRYRVFTFSPERFPDPPALHRELAALGFRTLAIVDPGVSVADGYRPYDEGKARGLFCARSDGTTYEGKVWPGATVFPDFTRAEVRDAWASFHAPLLEAGVGGFWNDMNDPVLKVGVVYDPLLEDVRHGARGEVPHRRVRNTYANGMAEATVAGMKRARPAERPFVLTRSGFPGIQRHAAVWTGDNLSTWEHLRESLHMVINLGLCGVPISGADVGGFGGRPGYYGAVKWRPPAELFVRWMELGALLPFMRVHTTLYSPRQEPWSFGKAALASCRRILQRRYRLLPTLYALALEAHETGMPLVRPLWLEHDVPHTEAREQFMLGDALLAAPVLEKGQTRRSVLLPPGTWIDFESGEALAGGRVVERAAPLGAMPLFAKAGTPLFVAGTGPVGRNAEAVLRGPLALEVSAPAPGAVGRARLFLDDGVNADGRRFVLRATTEDLGGRLRVRLEPEVETFAPNQPGLELRAPRAFSSVVIDGARHALATRSLGDEDREATAATARVPWPARELILE